MIHPTNEEITIIVCWQVHHHAEGVVLRSAPKYWSKTNKSDCPKDEKKLTLLTLLEDVFMVLIVRLRGTVWYVLFCIRLLFLFLRFLHFMRIYIPCSFSTFCTMHTESIWTHYRPAMPYGNSFFLGGGRGGGKDLCSSVLSQFKKYYPSRNLKFINLDIFQGLKVAYFNKKNPSNLLSGIPLQIPWAVMG